MPRMTEIQISIVLPNYNDAKYLPFALDSILTQKMPPFEVILIDDGSSDNSVEIMQRYAKKNPLFKIRVHEKNIGVVSTINEVLGLINGTHVFFLASDDWILPDFLSEAHPMLTQYPTAGFCSTGSWIAKENNTNQLLPILMNYPSKTPVFIPPHQAKKILYQQDGWFAGNTTIHNVGYLRREKGFNKDLGSYADGFMYRVLASKYGCCFIPKRLSVWRIRKGAYSQTSTKNVTSMRQVADITDKLMDHQYASLFPENLKRRMQSRLLYNLAKSMWRNQAKPTQDLLAVIKRNDTNIFTTYLLYGCLKFISYLPKLNNLVGQILLLLFIKPFDMLNITKAYSRTFLFKHLPKT